jgi:hypothetical protein
MDVHGPEEEDRIERSDRDGSSGVHGAVRKIVKRGQVEIPESNDPDRVLWQLEQFTGRVVQKHGATSVEAARAHMELSLQLGRMQRWEEVRSLREGSLASLRELRGEHDPETLQTEVSLAIALAHTGRSRETEVHLQHAASTSLEALGPDHEVTRLAQAKLDEFRRGQPNEWTV